MAIEGLICRSEWKLVEASGRHWMGECDDSSMHPGVIQYAVMSRRKPSLDHLSVTQVLGKVREEAIRLLDLPIYPEAQGFADMILGQFVDKMATEGLAAGRWMTQVPLVGEFWGIPFSGRADAVIVADGVRHVHDTKFTSEGQLYIQLGSGHLAKPEMSAQVSMYGQMYVDAAHRFPDNEEIPQEWIDFERQWGEATVTEGGVWLGAKVKAVDTKTKEFRRGWMPLRCQPMSIEEIAALHPGGSATTVRENADILWRVCNRIKAGDDKKAILAEVPLACERMYGGSCRPYCGANRVCLREAGIDPRTKGVVKVMLPDELGFEVRV